MGLSQFQDLLRSSCTSVTADGNNHNDTDYGDRDLLELAVTMKMTTTVMILKERIPMGGWDVARPITI